MSQIVDEDKKALCKKMPFCEFEFVIRYILSFNNCFCIHILVGKYIAKDFQLSYIQNSTFQNVRPKT